MGKVKIAETLCRAGLHLGATTVGRMLKEPSRRPAKPKHARTADSTGRVVFARYPGHLWHIDLTVVPTAAGVWTAWMPFSLPQCWPFCHWLAVAVDHYSRRIMGTAVFDKQPSSVQVRAFLGRTFAKTKAKPRHLVSDKGPQFWCHEFKAWCKRRDVRPRFGALGQHGSVAVVERMILTIKTLLTRRILVPNAPRRLPPRASDLRRLVQRTPPAPLARRQGRRGGVGPGTTPGPQPQTGRAGFQASRLS